MIDQEEDIFNYLGRALFIVLFFFFISNFSVKSANQTNNTSHYELVSDLHINSGKAVITDAILLPSYQVSWVSSLDKMNFRLFNESHKVSVDNRKIIHRITLLQKTRLSINPAPICRFYYHLFSIDTEELPVLS